MSQPICLNDDELRAVMNACRQLQLRDRDRFLREVARVIAELPERERGPGSVHRAIDRVEGSAGAGEARGPELPRRDGRHPRARRHHPSLRARRLNAMD